MADEGNDPLSVDLTQRSLAVSGWAHIWAAVNEDIRILMRRPLSAESQRKKEKPTNCPKSTRLNKCGIRFARLLIKYKKMLSALVCD